jgi:hypothetical protein
LHGNVAIHLTVQNANAGRLSLPNVTNAAYNSLPIFTTLDRIEGVVSVTATDDTRFDGREIAFVGKSTPIRKDKPSFCYSLETISPGRSGKPIR